MEHSYGQFGTLARAAEVLCERWTPLLVHELLCGSTRFNDLHRGLPRMSSSLLAQRLRRLEQAGVVLRVQAGKVTEYHLTFAGEQLRPIIAALGAWGERWDRSPLRTDELDAGVLMWDMRRALAGSSAVLAAPALLAFCFTDTCIGERDWWLAATAGEIALLRHAPRRPCSARISTSVRALTEVWRGDFPLHEAQASGALHIEGSRELVQRLDHWLASRHAGVWPPLTDYAPIAATASPRHLHN